MPLRAKMCWSSGYDVEARHMAESPRAGVLGEDGRGYESDFPGRRPMHRRAPLMADRQGSNPFRTPPNSLEWNSVR